MTARELVDSLLEVEGIRYLNVFGDSLPKTGITVRTQSGQDPFEVLTKRYSHLIPTQQGATVSQRIEDLIRKRYIFVLSDPTQPGIELLSNELRQRLPDNVIEILQRVYGVRPSTPVYWSDHVDAEPHQTFADIAVYGDKVDDTSPERGYPKMKEYSIGNVTRPAATTKSPEKPASYFMHTIKRDKGTKLAPKAKMTGPGIV